LSTREAPWRKTLEGIVITCRLTPKGGRDVIDGVARLSDGTSVLLARVRSAPEDGRANKALCALLAAKLDVPISRVTLTAGARGRLKQVAVSGEIEKLITRLSALGG
jgi:uncharacterized protein YggU (UPF0235/DUF167 family)